jgi:hypothetical protein
MDFTTTPLYITGNSGKDNRKNKYSLTDDELEHLMPQWITGWRKWQWGSFMIKYLQASGNMLNNTASISLFAVISPGAQS